ncbi:unnamed protein product [Ilex paraguariensis]|uniref:beta-galactosidase n=1 Tax=Ilex paraguariensis TaxID=185542 RepID=A0ABC8U879_9AQUA
MWPDLIAKSKEGGADVIETYAFWNGHEPLRGQYNFEGEYDIVKFVKLVGSSGLYFFLRIGPYICAEWNFGATKYNSMNEHNEGCNILDLRSELQSSNERRACCRKVHKRDLTS